MTETNENKLEEILEIYKKIFQKEGIRIQSDPSPRDPILYHYIHKQIEGKYWIFPENEELLQIYYNGLEIYNSTIKMPEIANDIKEITLKLIMPQKLKSKYHLNY